MEQTKLPVESDGNASRRPRAAWKKMLFTLLVVAFMARPALAVNGTIYVGMATDGIFDNVYWSVPPFFSTNAISYLYCGEFLDELTPAIMEFNVPFTLYHNYTSTISVDPGHEICYGYLQLVLPGCYDPYVNGVCVRNTSPNWNAGYAVPNGAVGSVFRCSFYIYPSTNAYPAAVWSAMDSTGWPTCIAPKKDQFPLFDDGMSRAIAAVTNTVYEGTNYTVTFILQDTNQIPTGSYLINYTNQIITNIVGTNITYITNQITLTNAAVFVAGTNAGTVEVDAVTLDPDPCLVTNFWFNLGPCTSCPNCPSSTAVGSVDLKYSLGSSKSGDGNAFLQVQSEMPNTNLGSPQSLQYNFSKPDVQVFTNSQGWLRQVRSLDRVVDIVTNTANSYILFFYHSTDIAGVSSTNGCYYFSNPPYQSVMIALLGTNHLQVTDSTYPNTADYLWETNGWALITGGGLRTETLLQTTNGSTYTKVRTIQGASGVTNFYSSETWQIFSYGARMIQETVGTGAAARSTTNVYTTDGMLQQVNRTDGSWDYYVYDAMDRQIGHYSPFLNSPFTTNTNLCRYTASTYNDSVVSGSGDCANLELCTPRMVVTTVLGNEVSRNYTVVTGGERSEIQCTGPGAAWNNASNLVTITDIRTDAVHLGEPWRITRPDYTIQLFAYDDNTTCPAGTGATYSKTTVWTGAPNLITMTSVTDGTMDESWTDSLMRNVMHRVTDVASGTVIEQEVYSFDSLNHVTNTVYLSRNSTGASYDCCNLESSVAQDGTVTSYGYDALKRQVLTVQNGIISSNILDANGNTLGTVRFGTDNSVITNNLSTYDNSGELTSTTDGLGNVTVYTNYFDASNQLIKATTYPDASTRVETYAIDGSLLSVTGTAVLPVQYAYGVQADGGIQRLYKTETKLGTNGTATAEATTTYTDMAGRNYKTVYASAAGSPASLSIYNGYGQLSEQVDPDGVTTLYGYNAKGEAVTNATDMNGNGAIDFGGSDRIEATISDVISDAYNLYVNRTRTFVWLTNGIGTSNLVATAETSVDGLQNWNIVWNNGVGATNHSQTVYIPAAGEMITTGVAPDGSSSVNTSQNGRLISTIQYDANGVQLGSTLFGYDAHGRQNLSSDGRNGTTVNYFNNNDQVTSMLTPSPDGVQAGELTTNVLDSRGRVIRTIQADGTSVTNLYYANGLLSETYGSRTYPVGYAYDYAGRMKTMTTWTNFAASGGAAVTTWNYDGYRGFLTNKVYANATGPGYGYTAAGRLSARVWARGITTSYGYDNAGGLSTVGYSDGTPGTTNGYDRLGRRIAVTNGATVCNWTYNNLGDVLIETYSGGPLNGLSVTNGYDLLLRRKNLALVNGSGTAALTAYGYDAASRLATVGDGTNGAGYGYLANSPLVGSVTFQRNGTTVMTTTKQYDLLNRLTSSGTVGGTNSFTYNYSYNPANQRTSVTNADNSYWVYQYDVLGQVISGKRYWAAGTPVAGQQFTYNFDTIGNRQSTTSGGDGSGNNLRSASYLIDNLNQYTSRSVPGYATILGSANSNATVSVNLQRSVRQGNYFADELTVTNTSAAIYQSLTNLAVLNNGTNADITVTNIGSTLIPQTPEAFVYDLDGNMATNGRFTVLWDGENRATNFTSLTTLPTASKIKVDCAYDFQGRRVQKIVSTNNGTAYVTVSTNRYIYDGWNLIGILDGGNNLQYSFQWGSDLSGSMQGAGGVGGLISMTVYGGANAGTYDYAYDGNGNVTGLINAVNSAPAGQWEYGPFGNLLRASGPMAAANVFLFCTKNADSDTGLNYYGQRYYDGGVGRWLNRDASEELGGANLYSSFNNNPINNFDPLGDSNLNDPPISVGKNGRASYDLSKPFQWHHPISWDNDAYDFQNHQLVKMTCMDLKTQQRLVALSGHNGRHSSTYHDEVLKRLDAALIKLKGNKDSNAARTALNKVVDDLIDDINSGKLKLYADTDVYVVPDNIAIGIRPDSYGYASRLKAAKLSAQTAGRMYVIVDVLQVVDIAHGAFFWHEHPHLHFDPASNDILDEDTGQWYDGDNLMPVSKQNELQRQLF